MADLVRVPFLGGDLLAIDGGFPNEGDRPVPLRPFCDRLGITMRPRGGVPRAGQDQPQPLTDRRCLVNLSDYQRAAARTLNTDSPQSSGNVACCAMGLAGEAGEVTDYLKKVLFHGHPLDRDKLCKELGDVLWYIAGVATSVGLDLDEVAQANLDKLALRYPDGFSSEASKARVDEHGGGQGKGIASGVALTGQAFDPRMVGAGEAGSR